jgi:cytoskeleton protein RodZ
VRGLNTVWEISWPPASWAINSNGGSRNPGNGRRMTEEPSMNEADGIAPPAPAGLSSGQLLKAERERAGLHIVALAAALKVPVRKLEALEADRWSELTDATFARALASSVARHLKIDAAPVLRGLPQPAPTAIGIPDGLGRASVPGTSARLGWSMPPVAWGVAGLLVAAALLYAIPGPLTLPWTTDAALLTSTAEDPANNASDASTPVAVPGFSETENSTPSREPVVSVGQDATTSATRPIATDASLSPTAPPPLLALNAVADTWIEVIDSRGVLRVQRVLRSGEALQFSDAPKFQVVLGNAAGAQVVVRGTNLDLGPYTRNNVARFDAQ